MSPPYRKYLNELNDMTFDAIEKSIAFTRKWVEYSFDTLEDFVRSLRTYIESMRTMTYTQLLFAHLRLVFFPITFLFGLIYPMIRPYIACMFVPIYNTFIVLPLTKTVYVHTADKINKEFSKDFSMVDIGTGTGLPLKSFMDLVPKASNVLAVDINPEYIKGCETLFQEEKRVQVRLQDWMEIEEGANPPKFDFIFFGFSFMLMPDKIEVSIFL